MSSDDTRATERPQPTDGGAEAARLLLAREPELLGEYLAALRAIHSPLAYDQEAWDQCAAQARRILADCAASLVQGVSVVSGTQIAEVVDLSGERLRQGVHLTHSIRAGMILLDVVLSALAESTGARPEESDWYTAAVRSLQQGVTRRLEVGSIGYDTLMLSRVRDLHEQGRRRLAREIHDQLGNSLSLAMRHLEMNELIERRNDAEVSPQLKSAMAAVMETMDISRQLITELRRSTISGSLETALKGFVASMGDRHSTTQIWVQGEDEWLPGHISEELYILVRECLRNAFRHSGAANTVVNIDIAPHEVQSEIVDDGCGFDTGGVRTDGGSSNGLDGMAERVQLLHGTVDISSVPGQGTRVVIWIPIEERTTQ